MEQTWKIETLDQKNVRITLALNNRNIASVDFETSAIEIKNWFTRDGFDKFLTVLGGVVESNESLLFVGVQSPVHFTTRCRSEFHFILVNGEVCVSHAAGGWSVWLKPETVAQMVEIGQKMLAE